MISRNHLMLTGVVVRQVAKHGAGPVRRALPGGGAAPTRLYLPVAAHVHCDRRKAAVPQGARPLVGHSGRWSHEAARPWSARHGSFTVYI